jgi:hypothetical protein
MNIDTNFSIKHLQTKFNNTLKTSQTVINLVSFQGCKDGSKYIKLINIIHHINRIKNKITRSFQEIQ